MLTHSSCFHCSQVEIVSPKLYWKASFERISFIHYWFIRNNTWSSLGSFSWFYLMWVLKWPLEGSFAYLCVNLPLFTIRTKAYYDAVCWLRQPLHGMWLLLGRLLISFSSPRRSSNPATSIKSLTIIIVTQSYNNHLYSWQS